jgi:TetR/AcrR family transcriptional regulator, repressor for neighboring sulfatase
MKSHEVTEMSTKKIKKPRTRRTPEEGRQLLLDAAEALFVEKGPDAVGLQSIAKRAGVSHSLITHYFGTYEKLVVEVVQRRNLSLVSEVRQELSAISTEVGTRELIDRFFSVLRNPAHTKLRAWMFLSGRALQQEVAAAMLTVLVDALYGHSLQVAQAKGLKAPTRESVGMAFLIGICATQWYTLAGDGLGRKVGVGPVREAEERFQSALGDMLSGWLGL